MADGLTSLLHAYDSDDQSASSNENTSSQSKEEEEFKMKPIDPSLSLVSSITIEAAPLVLYSVSSLKTNNQSLIELFLINISV